MCINNKLVYNKYIGKKIYVPCGKCAACQMERADRVANKIRIHNHSGYICLFAHLTYAPIHVPYINISELETIDRPFSSTDIKYNNILNVYRDSEIEFDNLNSSYKVVPKTVLLSDYRSRFHSPISYKPELNLSDYGHFRKLNGQSDPNKVGVIWTPDVQNFIKVLRKQAVKELENPNFDFFACYEYGSNFFRPHIHLLFYIPQENFYYWKHSIAKNWKYALYNLTYRNIEIAKYPSSYLATYVNKPSNFPRFFRENCSIRFRERFTHSKYFGRDDKVFSVSEVIKRVYSGESLTFSVPSRKSSESCGISTFPLPKYITNQFFPFSKGFSRLDDDEIFFYLSKPTRLPRKLHSSKFRYVNNSLYDVIEPDGTFSKRKYVGLDYLFTFDEAIKYKHKLQRKIKWFNILYNKIFVIPKLRYYGEKVSIPFIAHCQDFLRTSCNDGYRYADFLVRLRHSLVNLRWHMQFDKVINDIDNLQLYDNIPFSDVEWLNNLLNKYDLKKIDFDINSLACNVSRSTLKTYRFYKKLKTHVLNDSFNYVLNYNING